MWQAWERGETCIGFWWVSPKEKAHLKGHEVNRNMDLKEIGWECELVSAGSG
jgi:hypothetical protein